MTVLAERILDCFPGGSYALAGLLRLMDVVESDQVPTAAVECRVQPRLLVNPGFVARHAETPEKLLMLVMHELHHVLLGHTTLFPTATPVQNFVFDCVINGLISRMFPAEEHVSFLTDYYDDTCFPECLLRPPPGWTGGDAEGAASGISALPPRLRRRAEEVHRSLYSETGASYEEVFDVLPKLISGDLVAGVPLLGGHDEDGSTAGNLETRTPVLFDIVRDIVERWPQPPDPIAGRSLSDLLRDSQATVERQPSNRVLLRALLRKVADDQRGGASLRVRQQAILVGTPIPLLDRRSAVLRALGTQPLLYRGSVPWSRRRRAGEQVHVYVDVSGSMGELKGAIYGAILDCRHQVHPTVHLFSTRVADVSLEEVRAGLVRSDGGTDIVCVAGHMAANKVRRACVITDGWVGVPRGRTLQTLSGARLAVAYAGNHTNADDLATVTDHSIHLRIEG